MNDIDKLHLYAIQLAQEQESPNMVMTIEKELLHYEILNAMDEGGLLDHLVFQGGTSLRLCYGAERYSEDLDFSGGRDFDRDGLEALGDCITHAVGNRYQVSVNVKNPRREEGLVSAWTVIVNTTPSHKDIPQQRIKIEVASIDSHDPVVLPLKVNYAGLGSYSDIMLPVESRNEILADKIESFVCSEHVRYRDLWDLSWLSKQLGIQPDKVRELRRWKAVDYGEVGRYAEKYPLIGEKLANAFESDKFVQEMSRFLPVSKVNRTIARALWLRGPRRQLEELFADYPSDGTGRESGYHSNNAMESYPQASDAMLPYPDPSSDPGASTSTLNAPGIA